MKILKTAGGCSCTEREIEDFYILVFSKKEINIKGKY